MDRSIHRVAGPYRVTFSPDTWKLIGTMPTAIFQSLQRALESIAEVPHQGSTEGPGWRRAALDGLTVVYELDHSARTLTVLEVVEAGSRQAS